VKTIRITIDEPLLAEIDKAAAELGMSRSALMCRATRKALGRLQIRKREIEDAEAYARQPQNVEEELLPWCEEPTPEEEVQPEPIRAEA